MTTLNFKDYIKSFGLTEEIHHELQDEFKKKDKTSMQTRVAKKIRELSARGAHLGIEDKTPKGSSRMYMHHTEPHEAYVDGKHTYLDVGTKVAISNPLDKHLDKSKYYHDSLGKMQNAAENGDDHVNRQHRVLTEDNENPGHYQTNHDGIFPPLIKHDWDNAHWSTVGHSTDMKKSDFKKMTVCDTHPKGITHEDFCKALLRQHDRNHGKHWESPHDKHLDHVDEHPLVQKFADYHDETDAPPHDYQQLKNMGVWHHPDGSKHIVARDSGFSRDVMSAYHETRKRMYGGRF